MTEAELAKLARNAADELVDEWIRDDARLDAGENYRGLRGRIERLLGRCLEAARKPLSGGKA